MSSTQKLFSKDYFFGCKRSNYINYDWWDNDGYWKSIISAIKKYKMSGRMLDIGCAFGFLLKRVVPYFNEVYGIDISSFAIQRGKKEAPTAILKIVDFNKQELLYPDRYFDLITAFDFLEHTKSIKESLRKITKKLKDNGYLIILLPLRDTWAGKINRIFDKDPTHISVPSRKELFDAIDQAGFKILEKTYFLSLIFFRLKGIPVSIEIILQKKNKTIRASGISQKNYLFNKNL